MKGLANPDSKIYALLNKLVLLMELNILVFLCCIPVVTAGAAMCSMHTVLLKIYRNEDKRVVTDFFHAMKANFKNGTILWMLFLLYTGILAGLWGMSGGWAYEGAVYVLCSLLLAGVIGFLYLTWALILQSRYVYTVAQSLKYALLAWMQHPGSTFVYLISAAIPALLCFSVQTMPLVFMIGITLPQFISTTLYSRVFNKMEGIPDTLPEL